MKERTFFSLKTAASLEPHPANAVFAAIDWFGRLMVFMNDYQMNRVWSRTPKKKQDTKRKTRAKKSGTSISFSDLLWIKCRTTTAMINSRLTIVRVKERKPDTDSDKTTSYSV